MASQLVLVGSYRRTWRMLTALQEAWEQEQPVQHAQATGLVLGQMAADPPAVAESLLPVLIDFVDKRGPYGIDSLYVTALSAAAAYSPSNFELGVALADQLGERRPERAPKDEFVVHFLDLAIVPGFTPAELVNPSRSGPRFRGIPGITKPVRSRRPIGDAYVTSLLGVSYPDGIRNALYIDGVGKASQMMPGFGPALRNSMHKHDEYRLPNQSVANTEVNKTTFVTIAAYYMYQGLKALRVAASVAAPVAAIASVAAWEMGSWFVGAMAYQGDGQRDEGPTTPTDAGAAGGVSEEQGSSGVVDDPDKTKKMPVPDGVEYESVNPLDILEAALRYQARLNPLIYPISENLGHGYAAVHLPHPGNVDPLWEMVGGGLPDEEELLGWLGFVQAKYFDSSVNPTPTR